MRCGAVCTDTLFFSPAQRSRCPSRSIIMYYCLIRSIVRPRAFWVSSPSVTRVVVSHPSTRRTTSRTSRSPSTVASAGRSSRASTVVSRSSCRAPAGQTRRRHSSERSRKLVKITSSQNSYSLFILCARFAISHPLSSFIVLSTRCIPFPLFCCCLIIFYIVVLKSKMFYSYRFFFYSQTGR